MLSVYFSSMMPKMIVIFFKLLNSKMLCHQICILIKNNESCQFECVRVKILKSGFSLFASMDFIKLNFVNSLVEF
jgi:hypothetical protein